jgi:hypothetical protein
MRAKPPSVFQVFVDLFSTVFNFLPFNLFSANWLSTGDAVVAESFSELTKLNERYRLFLDCASELDQFSHVETQLLSAFNGFVETLDLCKTTKLVSRSDFSSINAALDLTFQQNSNKFSKILMIRY